MSRLSKLCHKFCVNKILLTGKCSKKILCLERRMPFFSNILYLTYHLNIDNN